MKKFLFISVLSLVLYTSTGLDVSAMQNNSDGNAMHGDKPSKHEKKGKKHKSEEKKEHSEKKRRKKSKKCEICHLVRDGELVETVLQCFKQNPETEKNKEHFVHSTCLQSYTLGKKEFIAQHTTPVVGWHYAPCPAHVGGVEKLCDGQLHMEEDSEQIVPVCSFCRLSEEDSVRLKSMPNEKFEDPCSCCGCKSAVHFSCLVVWIDQLIKRGAEACCSSVQCRTITDWAQRMKLAQQVIGRIEKVLGGQGPEKEMMKAYLQDIIFNKTKEMSGAAGFLLYAYFVSGGRLNTQLTAFFEALRLDDLDKFLFAMNGLFEYVGKRINNCDLRPILFLQKEQVTIYDFFLDFYSRDQVRICEALLFALEGEKQEIIDFLMGNESIKNALVNYCEQDGEQASSILGAALCVGNTVFIDFVINNETIKIAITTYLESNGQMASAILRDAFCAKKLELVDFLMSNKAIESAMANYLEDDGDMASDILRFALYKNKTELVSLLMSEKTKLEMLNYCKQDAKRAFDLLFYAIGAECTNVVELLIKSSIFLNRDDLEKIYKTADKMRDAEKKTQIKALIQERIKQIDGNL